MENQIVLALVFLAAAIASRSVFTLVTGVVGRGKATPPVQDKRPVAFRVFSGQIESCGNTVEALSASGFHNQTKAVRALLVANGLEDLVQPRDVIGLQGFAAISGSIAGALILFITTQSALAAVAASVVAGIIGWIYPRSWLSGRLKKRKEQIARDLPYCIDLLTVAMRAGQDFGAALRNLVREAPDGPLVIEFERLLKQISLGSSRTEALQRFSDRVAIKEVQSLVSAVIQSQEMGSSVTETLQIQAEEVRNARFHRAERKAARASSLMLMPMVIFILPATFIVIFTPIVIRMMNTLSSV